MTAFDLVLTANAGIARADTAQSGAETAVSEALDIFSLVFGALVGVALAFLAAALASTILRRVLRRSPVGSILLKRIRTSFYLSMMAWGAWIGLQAALLGADLSQWSNGTLVSTAAHVLLILAMIAMTGIAYEAAWVFEDAARLRQSADGGRARRFETQAQVVRRLLQLIVVIIGIVAVLSTFAAARQAMAALLASAGLISVIAGLAAQQTLGNVFAGIQLAFTDAIRVGDVVVANAKGDSGAIEEITLSYVVVRLWDERRLIVPSTTFTSQSFENWTRRAAAQLGTVELQLDWEVPMPLLRKKVESLLAATDLWDGRTWNVQMTASDLSTVTVRILASAHDSGQLWDLRCYLREHLIDWIVSEEPWIRPASRIQPQTEISVTKDTTHAQVAALAVELSKIAEDSSEHTVLAKDVSVKHSHEGARDGESSESNAAHAARMVAARRKAKRARRRAMADRMRELADSGVIPEVSDQTQVMTKGTIGRIIAGASTVFDKASGNGPSPRRLPSDGASSNAQTSVDTAVLPLHSGAGGDTGIDSGAAGKTGVKADGDTGAGGSGAGGTGAAGSDTRTSAGVGTGVGGKTDAPTTAGTAMTVPEVSATSKESSSQKTMTSGGRGERLYSGSPDAEERSEIFAGPGEEVLAEREAVAHRREAEAKAKLTSLED